MGRRGRLGSTNLTTSLAGMWIRNFAGVFLCPVACLVMALTSASVSVLFLAPSQHG
jgi:hypothetical protein